MDPPYSVDRSLFRSSCRTVPSVATQPMISGSPVPMQWRSAVANLLFWSPKRASTCALGL